MERIPEEGESVETGIFRLTASQVKDQTVEKLIIEIKKDKTVDNSEQE